MRKPRRRGHACDLRTGRFRLAIGLDKLTQVPRHIVVSRAELRSGVRLRGRPPSMMLGVNESVGVHVGQMDTCDDSEIGVGGRQGSASPMG
jgi:hypothetical protein